MSLYFRVEKSFFASPLYLNLHKSVKGKKPTIVRVRELSEKTLDVIILIVVFIVLNQQYLIN